MFTIYVTNHPSMYSAGGTSAAVMTPKAAEAFGVIVNTGTHASEECVIVASWLRDNLSHDELMAIIGHEMGHIALGHMRSEAAVSAAASESRIMDIPAFELEADAYSVSIGNSPEALMSAFKRIAREYCALPLVAAACIPMGASQNECETFSATMNEIESTVLAGRIEALKAM